MTDQNQFKDGSQRERDLARRLITRESQGDQSALGLVLGTERAFDRLYTHLRDLIGLEGFETLVRRALYLGGQECPFLQSVTTEAKPDQFRLRSLEASVMGQELTEIEEGLAAVVGYFFWLLVTFVGDNLFNRIIRGAWPDVTAQGWDAEGNQG